MSTGPVISVKSVTSTAVTALILAGGQSRRFGTSKALYRIDGRRMIDRVYDVLAPLGVPVLLSLRPGMASPLDRAVPVIVDQHPGSGPLGGLHAGLAAIRTDWLLLLACDMPYLTRDALVALLHARTPHTDAVVAQGPDGRQHPLCACYHRRIRPQVDAQLASGDYAMHALLSRLPHVTPQSVEADAVRNLNTPPPHHR